ncbi:MAG: hypothetical protein A2540_02865 [Sulfurimonas sp. RIFOXYD2_FULL_37_8]|nr:MAG: hypothetical protein A2540_02865 [Sulfurimonas sp. RIFOXYD2_FULL_37_8]
MRNLSSVPRSISDEIVQFCGNINPLSKPIYVDSFPLDGNSVGNCFNNVEDTLNSSESSILGWIIWQTSSYLLQAEFHNVIKSGSGKLICVTPYSKSYDKILFLEDSAMKYENKRVPTIYKAMDDSTETATFIHALEALSEVEVYMSDALVIEHLSDPQNIVKRNALQGTMRDIENAIGAFEAMVLKDIDRNSKCICGSGKKFKKCCGAN